MKLQVLTTKGRREDWLAGVNLMPEQELITELQHLGMRLDDDSVGAASRKGGAGPSDHKAVTVNGRTVMVPVHTHASHRSPYVARTNLRGATLERDGVVVGVVSFPKPPKFYGLQTHDGIPYWKIAVLHGSDVLATTVMQNCIRYQNRETTCQFCAIGQSLKAGRTVARKTPEQLGEVARAAVLLDDVKHVVLTTGTPNLTDRGAQVLAESAAGIKDKINLPIQAQCEPPDDFGWFRRMKEAGVDALGMHLEAVEQSTRTRIMPGKATVSLEVYMAAFEAAVDVFGFGQVHVHPRRARRFAGGSPRHGAKTDWHGRVPVRGAVRADQRDAAGALSGPDGGIHAAFVAGARWPSGGSGDDGRHDQGRLRQVRGVLFAVGI